jgi:hypothetical protein
MTVDKKQKVFVARALMDARTYMRLADEAIHEKRDQAAKRLLHRALECLTNAKNLGHSPSNERRRLVELQEQLNTLTMGL